MKNKLPILIILMFFIACTRKPQEYISFFAINNSGVEIKFFTPNSSEIYETYPLDGAIRRITNRNYSTTTINEENFDKTLNLPSPIKVVFNNSDTVYHYNDSLLHYGKYLNKSSNRCLFNFRSYVINKEKHGDVLTFTFTPNDYEFAKQ
ncbi:MAG TPA: hypothetical protein PK191_10325 [Niabella sp.]|nr:hypothetical protein [Niabella sp.]HOZ97298.1 hypothetical protein [Niabella sp.]HQW15431.1 hypothetical protein [Niabella sp.]HQX20523.1 hypothetical protein [Niabella sp.]HRB05756.1 hypothetical protein [Niabella sp.]